ncbi:hypothetical protein RhiirA5_382265 [Rhizophagus irregularis]|uniref:Uncharacterized protein n=1 Tax=Rhizophagus irregularis TaxID=588596 RepID=A0A2N0P1J0_9GLOM|nr:hypothetical protein RhiirA5_382265 [Rhizophagus irregularis]
MALGFSIRRSLPQKIGAKMRQPCSACRRPTKLVKPTGVDNGLCSYCNKSNYQIRHVNMLRNKAQMFDLYTSEMRLRGVALKGFAYSYLFSYIERAFVVALLLLMLVLSCYLCGMLLGGNLYIISCVHAPLCSADFVNIMFALEVKLKGETYFFRLENLASEQDKSHLFEASALTKMVFSFNLKTKKLGKGDMLTGFEPSMILSLNLILDFDMFPGLVDII